MLTLVLGDYGHARIWINDLPGDALAGPGENTMSLTATDKSPAVARKSVALEVAWHIGPVIRYGMLGGEWKPEEGGQYSVCIPITNTDGRKWAGSMANKYDDVRVGIPAEYSGYAIDGLDEGVAILGRGKLSVTHAAHGMVGSSPDWFCRLGHALVRILCLTSSEPEMMREIVISSCGNRAQRG